MMRVLISGGGIAWLTLAYWLHQYNIVPVVIEQAVHIRHDGYGIDFFGTGYDVAERMSLIDRLRSQQIPFEYVSYVNASDEPVWKLSIALMQKIVHGKYIVLSSKLGLLMQQVLMKLLLRDAFIGLLRQQFGAESLLQMRVPNAGQHSR